MGRPKKNRIYFGIEEEEAVKQYIKSDDDCERELIFNDKLKYPLTKMIESIIRTYKLYRPGIEFDDIHTDTFSFLLTKIQKFDPDKGTKAYSYIGTICKHYLLAQTIKQTKETKQKVSFDDCLSELHEDPENTYTLDGDVIDNKQLIENVRVKIEKIIDSTNITPNEKKVGDSLLYIFNNWELIFENSTNKKFNKNLILFIIRERAHLTTKEIRQSMKKYKKIYGDIKTMMIETDV